MSSHVYLNLARACEKLSTIFTGVCFLTCMVTHMMLTLSFSHKTLTTLFISANEGFFTILNKSITRIVSTVLSPTYVYSQMGSKIFDTFEGA